MRRVELPGVLGADDVMRTARSIAAAQETSGAVPWFPGGHVDPWDHVECAMALSAAGFRDEAEAAYEWSRATQRADGSWPARIRGGVVEDASADTNFCAYLATGVWHHFLVTGSAEFAARMWPAVRPAMEFVLGLQNEIGGIGWSIDASGCATGDALLAGSASVYQSLRCALALAGLMGAPQPDWEIALGRLGHALRHHEDTFLDKSRYSMDWYYPILGGAVRGSLARRRLRARWEAFVVPGKGARCVSDRPWVTGAETCELALSLDAAGERASAVRQVAAMQHLREHDGSYWTGLVLDDGKRWPVERTTWTGAAVILAADALSPATPGSGIFRAADLPTGLPADGTACGCFVPMVAERQS